MSLLDPNIILQAGNINDPSKVLTLRDLAMKVQAQQQQVQSKNALKQLFTQPGALDATGNPTPQTIAGVMAIDPETGMALHQNLVTQQATQAKLSDDKLARQGTIQGLIDPVRTAAINAYDASIKAGQPVQAANDAAQKVLNEGLQPIISGGLLHPDEASQLTTKFDYGTFTARSADWQKQQEKLKADKLAERKEDTAESRADEQAKRTDALIANQGAGAAEKGWEVLTDPSKKDAAGNPIQYRYNPGTAASTTLDGKQPYEPGGAAKMGSSSGGETFTPEMGALMAALAEKGVSLPSGMRSKSQQAEMYGGLLARNPGKTPDEIADLVKTGKIELGAQQKEVNTAAGIAGRVEVAANEIQEMTPLVLDMSEKVPRTSFVPLNRLIQTADTALSDPNLKELKIRINSLLNAYDVLAARGGTDAAKREEVRGMLLSADSPEALKAAIHSFGLEAQVAHKAAVEATKVPELKNEDKPPGTDDSGWSVRRVQ